MRTILLAVVGLSPQVITETLYALHQNGRRVDAIHLITTRPGKEKILGRLLPPRFGHYYKYLKEYNIDPNGIDFNSRNIHVITSETGTEADDITGTEENEQLLKKCLELAFRFTREPDTCVLFSVAGGRKTMSSCLTLAAQMYGRPADRLYHVLVSPEFESNRDFFYPPKKSVSIELRDPNRNWEPFYKETRYAKVNLINMPFVSIRSNLSPKQLDSPQDPGALMLSLIKDHAPRLSVALTAGKIVYRTLELDVMPARLSLYAFFVMLKKDCTLERPNCKGCTDCFLEFDEITRRQDDITKYYQKVCGSRPLDEMSEDGITKLSHENFRSYKSKIRKDLITRFGSNAAELIEIASAGRKPDTRYGIRIDRSLIEIIY